MIIEVDFTVRLRRHTNVDEDGFGMAPDTGEMPDYIREVVQANLDNNHPALYEVLVDFVEGSRQVVEA